MLTTILQVTVAGVAVLITIGMFLVLHWGWEILFPDETLFDDDEDSE